MDLRRLPERNAHGNYWFGDPGGVAPAILAAKGGGYLVSLGSRGMVWDGGRLMIFPTPVDALKELRRRMGVK